MSDRDLSLFIADNQKWKNQRHRVPWKDRVQLIEEQFPAVIEPDWNVILRDEDIFGRILKDILKVDQMEPGRAGPRPNLDYERGIKTWKQITGQDYSDEPFLPTFRHLIRGQSRRTIARKTKLSRSKVDRLLLGHEPPKIDELRVIARAYGKQPSFFAEYRAEYILAAIATRLDQEAELTVVWYRKLVATP
jgi:DNA-binding phage protein